MKTVSPSTPASPGIDVIPAKAGIQRIDVIPAKAGIQGTDVILAKAGIQGTDVIPAKAGIQGVQKERCAYLGPRLRGDDVLLMPLVTCAGMTCS